MNWKVDEAIYKYIYEKKRKNEKQQGSDLGWVAIRLKEIEGEVLLIH